MVLSALGRRHHVPVGAVEDAAQLGAVAAEQGAGVAATVELGERPPRARRWAEFVRGQGEQDRQVGLVLGPGQQIREVARRLWSSAWRRWKNASVPRPSARISSDGQDSGGAAAADAPMLVGAAGVNEAALRRADVVRALLQPALGLGQRSATQERAGVVAGTLPFGERAAQPLLPGPEGAVGLDPVAQAVPTGDQRLVDELDRLRRRVSSRPVTTSRVAASCWAASPAGLVELGPAGDSSGVRRSPRRAGPAGPRAAGPPPAPGPASSAS